MSSFKVTSLKQILEKIIPHFDKYNLITQKRADYILFKQIVMLMEQGKHLSARGERKEYNQLLILDPN